VAADISALIDSYKVVDADFSAALDAQARLNIPALTDRRAKLAAELAKVMQPNWPYKFDDKSAIVKRRKNLFSYGFDVIPLSGEVPTNFSPATVPSTIHDTLVAGIKYGTILAIVTAVLKLFSSGIIPIPGPTPKPDPIPDPKPDTPTVSAVYKAGADYVTKHLAPKFGESYQKLGDDVISGKIPDQAFPDHKARLKQALQPPPDDAALKALEQVAPTGTDQSTLTADQKAKWGGVMKEYGTGMSDVAKTPKGK
jgi:hypothetical protein